VDLSLGVPGDAPSDLLGAPLDGWPRGYPPSAGSSQLRAAARDYLARTFGVEMDPQAVAACAGAKEFIASLPQWLRSRDPARDTVLVPGIGYPTYAAGARAAGCRVVRIPLDDRFRLRPDRLASADIQRAVCVWVNSPANPTGVVEPLEGFATWGRNHRVPVCSDESYAELNWRDRPRSILEHGADGVLAVHSLSKRSNAPDLRVGFYAGDRRIVAELVTLRRQAGLMPSAPAQVLATRLLRDDDHAQALRERCARRLAFLVGFLTACGMRCSRPHGGMFAWVRSPTGDGDGFARWCARVTGLVLAPGSQYGPAGAAYVRIAAVQDEGVVLPRLLLLAQALDGLLGDASGHPPGRG